MERKFLFENKAFVITAFGELKQSKCIFYLDMLQVAIIPTQWIR